jgi:hypothetical protein
MVWMATICKNFFCNLFSSLRCVRFVWRKSIKRISHAKFKHRKNFNLKMYRKPSFSVPWGSESPGGYYRESLLRPVLGQGKKISRVCPKNVKIFFSNFYANRRKNSSLIQAFSESSLFK